MTEPTFPTATEAPAVAGRLDQPVRPHAWADDMVMDGRVGNCASDAAKVYWQRSNIFDRMMAERLTHPLYALAEDEVAAVNKLRAQKARAAQVDMKRCQCDHNEYCRHCWPEDFRPGGLWSGYGA